VKLIFYAKYLPKSHKSNKATGCEKERGREEERDGEFPGKREGKWGKRRRTHLLLDNFDSGPAFGLPSNLLPPFSFFSDFSLSFAHSIPVFLAPLRFESLSAALFISLP